MSVESAEFWWIFSARFSELLLIYLEEFLRKLISSKKEPKICILTFSKNFVILATFSSTIVKSALFVSEGTFSESLFLYENSNSYTEFRIESKYFPHCPDIFGTVAKTAFYVRGRKFSGDEINWSNFMFRIEFKKWAKFFSQCCQNCIVHVQTDIFRKTKSFKKLKFAIKFKSWEKFFFGIEFKTGY